METVIVYYVDAPPKGTERIGSHEYQDYIRDTAYRLWRNRWCVVANEAIDWFGVLDQRLKDLPSDAYDR